VTGRVFDRVVIVVDGRSVSFTADQFLALPLADRIRYILGKQCTFYRGATPVDTKVALASLRGTQG